MIETVVTKYREHECVQCGKTTTVILNMPSEDIIAYSLQINDVTDLNKSESSK